MSAVAMPPRSSPEADGLTRAFAEFVCATGIAAMPQQVRLEARRAIADCLGGALAGAGEAIAAQAASLAGEGAGPCTLWGSGRRASARDAALANGCAAHAHAIDDTNESMRGHPSAPIVPAVLALGEELGASGDALVEAYVLGVEIAAKLGLAVNDRHSQLGWHTTCTLGAVGSAAACARLLRLDRLRTSHALGIAASMAGGLRVNFGTTTKALHAGLAAQHGLLAARLAQAGVTASEQALEGHEGFLALFCGADAQPARALAALGAPFELERPGIVYKRYPTCSLMHALVDMVLEARAGLPEPHQVDTIRCGISARLQAARTGHWPATGLAAKFHVEYCVAAAWVGGTQDPSDFTDAALDRSQVRALARRVEVCPGEDFPAGNGDYAELTLLGADAKVLFQERRAKPRGHPSHPMDDAAHHAKFMRLAGPVLGAAQAAGLQAALVGAEPFPDARALGRLLGG